MRASIPPPRWPKAEASDIDQFIREREAAYQRRARRALMLQAVFFAVILFLARVSLHLLGIWTWPR